MAETNENEDPKVPVEVPVPPSPAALPDEPETPEDTVAMETAFVGLCQAMTGVFTRKNDASAVEHAAEIQGWYANGGVQITRAWQRAVVLLEKAVGAPMRG